MSCHLSALARLRGGILTLSAVVAVNVWATPAAAQPDPEPAFHTPPVNSQVTEEFRAPASPYGPGNRGLKYDTMPGEEVRASAGGEVVFAGPVAGSLHVTVRHQDGVRTSYSYLFEIAVVVGQRVDQGDRIGAAGGTFHFGARIGDSYFDPATLFGGLETTVELLPFEVPPGTAPQSEAMALQQIVARGGWAGSWPDVPLPGLGDAVDWLTDGGRHVAHYAGELNALDDVVETGRAVAEHVLFPPACTPDREPVPPPGERVALTVGGLGSSSASSSVDGLDVAGLGYEPEEVARFSYAGGLTPETGAEMVDHTALAEVSLTDYTSEDTQGDLHTAAARLVEVIEAMASARSDVVVDLYAHSMGGVVVRLALDELERRGFQLERLGLVATLGTPHQGANMATAADAANRSVVGRAALGALEDVIGTGLDPRSEAVAQLSSTSSVIAELEREGVPEEVDLVSVAARGDLTVPAPRVRAGGARNVTVPETGWSAHGELVSAEATTRELSLALGDLPPRCVGVWDVLQDEVVGRGLAYGEDMGGAALAGLP